MKSKPINIVKKTWGKEIWIHNDEDYCGKILIVEKNKKCSLHYHKLKKETFYVSKGSIYLFTEEADVSHLYVLEEGDVFEVSVGLPHQFEGIAQISHLVEVSTQHFDSDSYRILQ